jgi:hypothetical protein
VPLSLLIDWGGWKGVASKPGIRRGLLANVRLTRWQVVSIVGATESIRGSEWTVQGIWASVVQRRMGSVEQRGKLGVTWCCGGQVRRAPGKCALEQDKLLQTSAPKAAYGASLRK